MSGLISFVPSTPASTTSSGVVSQGTLSDNFDTFLTILTAQIQNQDPLEPLDSNQFTQQLVQFSGVEQQIRTNDQLESLLSATRSSMGASLAGYLGQTAEIDAAGAGFSGDPLSWRYELGADAAAVKLSVVDASGREIFAATGEKTAGAHDFEWDGRDKDGRTVGEGAYFLAVTAADANETKLAANVSVVARITGVDLSADEPSLTTTAGIYAYSDIRRLMKP
jgi:flagellar basal-body rod modification protein FlgD